MKIARTALAFLFLTALNPVCPVEAQSQAPPPPDFAIKSLRIDPAVPYANSYLTIYAEVENVGKERVDNVQIVVNFMNPFGGQSTTSSLGPGETTVLSASAYHPAPGNYEVKATLSLGGSGYGLEENKANNEKTIVFQVREGREPGTSPDLALTNTRIGDTGLGYQIETTIRNLGIDPASCAFDISMVTEVTKGARQVMKRQDVVIPASQAFAPGAEKKMGPFPVVDKDHPAGLEEGTYKVSIAVYNTIGTFLEETDTNNNSYQGTFTIGKGGTEPPLDFAIKSLRIEPAVPYANSFLTIYAEVENAGTTRVDNVQIVVNFMNPFGGQSTTGSLGPGETTVLSASAYHPSPGNYEIKADLSLGGSGYGLDANKSNNAKTINFEVRQGREPGTSPDLALTDTKIGDTGGAYQVEAKVRNIGTDPAKCVFNIALVTEVTKGTRQVMKREDMVIPAHQPFAPGAEKKVGPFPVVDKDHPGTLEEGTYNVRLGVYNTIGTTMEETDTKNNHYQGTFTVEKAATTPAVPPGIKIPKAKAARELRAGFFTASPVEIHAGQEVVLRWSLPDAAEAVLIVDNKRTALQIPAGQMKVRPACDIGTASFCYATYRIVGKTKNDERFDRQVRIKILGTQY